MQLKNERKYIYSRVEEDLEKQIANGILSPKECILSEKKLSEHYNISRISTRRAITNLVKKELLYRIPGKGTFVSESLPKHSSGQISVSFVVPDVNDFFLAEVCRGIQMEAQKFGYNLIIQSSGGNIELENSNIKYLLNHDIRGAIIFPNWGLANFEAIFNLKKAGIPFVLVDRYFKDLDSDYVGVDNYKGAFEATEYLINMGHEKIIHIYGFSGSANDERLNGYKDAMGEAGLYKNITIERTCSDTKSTYTTADRFEPDRHGGFASMQRILANAKLPTAIFAGNDYLALGATQAIQEAGLKCPDDISLVGFDNLKISPFFSPPLTTVHQPKCEIGKTAVQLLKKRIDALLDGEELPFEHMELKSRLIVRSSCGGGGSQEKINSKKPVALSI